MAYSVIADVKEILGITDTADDTELTNCIADGDSQIDEFLRSYTAVPLSSTPTEIGKISALFAAGVFRTRRSPEEGEKFIKRAAERVHGYIRSNYKTGTGGFTGTGGIQDSASD